MFYVRNYPQYLKVARFASRVLDPVLHSVGREIGVLSPELSPIPEGGRIT